MKDSAALLAHRYDNATERRSSTRSCVFFVCYKYTHGVFLFPPQFRHQQKEAPAFIVPALRWRKGGEGRD